MRIKIRDTVIDTAEEPAMLIFDDVFEKQATIKNLKEMPENARKYCIAPEDIPHAAVKQFMIIKDTKK